MLEDSELGGAHYCWDNLRIFPHKGDKSGSDAVRIASRMIPGGKGFLTCAQFSQKSTKKDEFETLRNLTYAATCIKNVTDVDGDVQIVIQQK